MLFIFAGKEKGRGEERIGKKIPHAFRDPNSGEQPSLENKQQQKLTAFSLKVHLLEPAVWVWLGQDRQRPPEPHLQVGSPHFFFQSKVVLGINPRVLGDASMQEG